MNYIGIAQPIRFTWFVLLCIICQTGCKIPPNKPLAVAFYNVENLFDTLDDPSRLDDDFTPGGKQGWTEERYQTKLTNLSRVIDAMGSPELIGVAEIENEQVLQDLQKKLILLFRIMVLPILIRLTQEALMLHCFSRRAIPAYLKRPSLFQVYLIALL